MTPAQIKKLRHPGGSRPAKIAVGGVPGLLMQIQVSGAKSWVLRGRFGEWQASTLASGKIVRARRKREIGLGSYPEVLPGEARDKAREFKRLLAQGVDPVAERVSAKAKLDDSLKRMRTFSEAFEEYSNSKSTEFGSEKYRLQWRSICDRYALPVLGNLQVQEVGLSEILKVLQPIWESKNPTATKLRQILEGTLAFSKVHGYRTGDNPAIWKGNLSIVLGAPSKVNKEKKYPTVAVSEVPRWWVDLSARGGMGAAALKFQAMTATRTGAIRYATWDEFDLVAGLWTIQPGRIAAKVYTRDGSKKVVITPFGVSFLQSLPRHSNSPYVFWSPRGKFLSDATIGKVMKSIHEADVARGNVGYADPLTGIPAVPHGLRSTFRTWVSDCTDFDADMAEIALFHKVGTKVQQAYDRSEMIAKRRVMMQAWENYLCSASAFFGV